MKKIELTVDDGRLDCGKDENGKYSCAEVIPIKDITGICVDDQTSVGLTGNLGVVPVSFADDDWSTIVAAINSGTHPYSVGDTKQIDMGSFGTHAVRLANLSTPSECSNSDFSQTACGTVIEFANIIAIHNINGTNTTFGGWPASKMRTYIKNDIYNSLPTDLKSVVIDTKVVSGHGKRDRSNFTSIDKLYLLSTAEIWEGGSPRDSAATLTRQLDYYSGVTTTNNYSKVIKQNSTDYKYWWLRVPVLDSEYFVFGVDKYGKVYSNTAVGSMGVSPAFRIG